MAEKSKPQKGYVLKIYQARLDRSVSIVGTMNPQLYVKQTGIEQRSEVASGADKSPKWYFSVPVEEGEVELGVVHKPLMLREVLVGSCELVVKESGGWAELFYEGLKAGSVKFSVQLDVATYSDPRTQYLSRLNDLELEREEMLYYKQKYKLKLEDFKRQYRCFTECRVKTEASFEFDAEEQSGRQDEFIKNLMKKIKTKTKEIQNSQKEIALKRKALKEQEEKLIEDKTKIKKLREEISQEKRELEEIKEKMSSEYADMKRNKQKVKLHNKLIEKSKEKTKKPSIPGLNTCRNNSPVQSKTHRRGNINLSSSQPWEVLSMEMSTRRAYSSRTPNTSEKLRPPLHPLAGNSASRLISFE